MSKRRKDNKGRILKTGEGQRKDGRYYYRYKGNDGKERFIYSWNLFDLRENEKQIQRKLDSGIDYSKGNITVIELAEKYLLLHQGVRETTKAEYKKRLDAIKKSDTAQRKIKDVHISDVKRWFIQLQNEGKKYSTIAGYKRVLTSAFQMAYEEEIIKRNPFDFKLSGTITNDSEKRQALTEEQQKRWFDFIRADNVYSKHYNEWIVFVETGMRVSELCGLTKNDIDFENERIKIDHQLIKLHGEYKIMPPKTKNGIRYIPMTPKAFEALQEIVKEREKKPCKETIDGYSGFLFLTAYNKPKTQDNVWEAIKRSIKKYNKLHPNKKLPNVTPHVLRHTFCSNSINDGVRPEDVQVILGHSDLAITMNRYNHPEYENVEKRFQEIEGRHGKAV